MSRSFSRTAVSWNFEPVSFLTVQLIYSFQLIFFGAQKIQIKSPEISKPNFHFCSSACPDPGIFLALPFIALILSFFLPLFCFFGPVTCVGSKHSNLAPAQLLDSVPASSCSTTCQLQLQLQLPLNCSSSYSSGMFNYSHTVNTLYIVISSPKLTGYAY